MKELEIKEMLEKEIEELEDRVEDLESKLQQLEWVLIYRDK